MNILRDIFRNILRDILRCVLHKSSSVFIHQNSSLQPFCVPWGCHRNIPWCRGCRGGEDGGLQRMPRYRGGGDAGGVAVGDLPQDITFYR